MDLAFQKKGENDKNGWLLNLFTLKFIRQPRHWETWAVTENNLAMLSMDVKSTHASIIAFH